MCPRAFNQRVVLREHIRSHHSAPDTVHGTSAKPFYCSLCGDLFSASLELISHLIEHSDRSTAAKRVQPTGPRKYKRRRRLSDAESPVQNSSETRTSSRKTMKQNEKKETSFTKSSFISSSELKKIPKKFVEFELPKDFFEVDPRGLKKDMPKRPTNNSTTSRAKMIFTEKTRVPALDGKRKTRTLIQKKLIGQRHRGRAEEEDNKKVSSDSGSETCSNEEDALNVLLKRERKLSEKFTVDLVNDLQEILRSPLKISEKIVIEEEDLLDNSKQQFDEKGEKNYTIT